MWFLDVCLFLLYHFFTRETIELVFLRMVVEAWDYLLSMSGHSSFEFYLISPAPVMRTTALVTSSAQFASAKNGERFLRATCRYATWQAEGSITLVSLCWIHSTKVMFFSSLCTTKFWYWPMGSSAIVKRGLFAGVNANDLKYYLQIHWAYDVIK